MELKAILRLEMSAGLVHTLREHLSKISSEPVEGNFVQTTADMLVNILVPHFGYDYIHGTTEIEILMAQLGAALCKFADSKKGLTLIDYYSFCYRWCESKFYMLREDKTKAFSVLPLQGNLDWIDLPSDTKVNSLLVSDKIAALVDPKTLSQDNVENALTKIVTDNQKALLKAAVSVEYSAQHNLQRNQELLEERAKFLLIKDKDKD